MPINDAREMLGTLTEGQSDVIELVARHMSSKEIARQLNIAPATVDQRVKAVWKKLGTTDRKSAARKYMVLRQLTGQPIYEGLVYERSNIVPSGGVDQSLTPKTTARAPFVFRNAQGGFAAAVFGRRSGFLGQFDKRFGRWGRAGWIVVCALVLALVFLLIVPIGTAIESLI